MSYFIGKLWFCPYSRWSSLGPTKDRRQWFFRVYRGESMVYKTVGIGILGINLMMGIKK